MIGDVQVELGTSIKVMWLSIFDCTVSILTYIVISACPKYECYDDGATHNLYLI